MSTLTSKHWVLRCNDLVAAHLLVKLPCVKAQGVICACMVLSTNLANMLTYHCEYGCSQLISKHFVLRWTKHMLLKVTKGKGKAESYTKAFILKPWWLLLPRIFGLKLTSLWLLEKFVTLIQCKALCADGTF